MIRSLRGANMLLAFGLELAMLAAFCLAGWVATSVMWLKVGLAIGLPGIAIVLWAIWAAPRAGKRRLKQPALLIFKIAIFAVATAAWWAAGQSFIAAVFGALVVINLCVAALFKQN